MPDKFAHQCVRFMLAQYRDESADFDFILALEQLTGMDFVPQTSNTESLCYAQSPDLRPEYKTSFTTTDLWTYVANHANPRNADINAHLKTIFPKSKQQFWETVNHMNI
jgi:hypothetical protein